MVFSHTPDTVTSFVSYQANTPRNARAVNVIKLKGDAKTDEIKFLNAKPVFNGQLTVASFDSGMAKLVSVGQISAEVDLRHPQQMQIFDGQELKIEQVLAETTPALMGPKFWTELGVKGPQMKLAFPNAATDLRVANIEMGYKIAIIKSVLMFARDQLPCPIPLHLIDEEQLSTLKLLPVEEEKVRKRMDEEGKVVTREGQEASLKNGGKRKGPPSADPVQDAEAKETAKKAREEARANNAKGSDMEQGITTLIGVTTKKMNSDETRQARDDLRQLGRDRQELQDEAWGQLQTPLAYSPDTTLALCMEELASPGWGCFGASDLPHLTLIQCQDIAKYLLPIQGKKFLGRMSLIRQE